MILNSIIIYCNSKLFNKILLSQNSYVPSSSKMIITYIHTYYRYDYVSNRERKKMQYISLKL